MTSSAFAPATIANLSVGYDTLGMALHSLGDVVKLTKNNLDHHRIVQIVSDIELPMEVDRNSCTAVIIAMQRAGFGQDVFVDVIINKGFQAGSGLGSSAASSVAAAVAFNHLLPKPLSRDELLPFCAEGERIACGSPILDNVAASLFGGIILIQNKQVIQLPMLSPLYAVAIFQQIEIRTEDARAVLPKQISMATATNQMSNIALFVHGLHTNNFEYIRQSFQDELAEPYRKELIPYFDEMKHAALELGALGFGISGSGPTVFALTNSLTLANTIESKLMTITHGAPHKTISIIEDLSKNGEGAKVIEA